MPLIKCAMTFREDLTKPTRPLKDTTKMTSFLETATTDPDRLTEARCCFNGCSKAYRYKHGMPKGWQGILMYYEKEPGPDLNGIQDWKRDGLLCPSHAKAVQDLLFPLLGSRH